MAQKNKRWADVVKEIDQISEICDEGGHVEVAQILDEVAQELTEMPEPTKAAKRAAKAPKSPKSTELRNIARDLRAAGAVREARDVLRVADDLDLDMDMDLEPEEPAALDDEGLEAPAPEAGGCVPCPTCGANPPQPEEAPAAEEEEAIEPAMDVSLEEEPSEEAVAAMVKVLEKKLAAFENEDESEDPEASLAALEAVLQKEGESEEADLDAQKLLAEIDELEAKLQPKAAKVRKPAAKVASNDKLQRTIRRVARDLEQKGKGNLANRVRKLV